MVRSSEIGNLSPEEPFLEQQPFNRRGEINAAAVKGKANKDLIDFLAKEFGTKKSEIEIMSGHTSKLKKTKVIGQGTGIQKRIDMLVG